MDSDAGGGANCRRRDFASPIYLFWLLLMLSMLSASLLTLQTLSQPSQILFPSSFNGDQFNDGGRCWGPAFALPPHPLLAINPSKPPYSGDVNLKAKSMAIAKLYTSKPRSDLIPPEEHSHRTSLMAGELSLGPSDAQCPVESSTAHGGYFFWDEKSWLSDRTLLGKMRSPVIGRRVSLKLTMDADRLNIASTEKAFHERERTTMRETVTYIADVKEAFLDEPAKFDEFLKLMKDVCDHKIDEANGSAMMAEIIKGHPNLLLRLGVFFPKYSVNKHKGKRTIPPDDEHGGSAESSNNKKNRAANFMENLEARFQGDGGHVVNSVLQIIRMYTIEGNKSKNEAYHEVVALLQGHVDLIMEFGEYFSDKLSLPSYA